MYVYISTNIKTPLLELFLLLLFPALLAASPYTKCASRTHQTHSFKKCAAANKACCYQLLQMPQVQQAVEVEPKEQDLEQF